MKYTIELTNKQKKQMDLMCELFHRYVGFNPKLEMIETTNVEDTNEYQIGYKVGFEDGKKQAIEEIPELANKENEIYNDGYNKGLEDVNHAMDVLKSMTGDECAEWFEDCVGVDEVVCGFTVQRIVEITKAYEEKKKAEIRVGDVVKFNEKCHNYDHVKSREFLVLHVFDNGLVTLLYDNGDTGAAEISLLDKTSRHIDEIEQLLAKLRGENNENQ